MTKTEERADYLPGGMIIHQRPDVFTYSMDAVLLAMFADAARAESVIDLCAGTGAIPLLLASKTQAAIRAVELQPKLCRLMERSISTNGLQEQIRVEERDLLTLNPAVDGPVDLVTCNPPYFAAPKMRQPLEEAGAKQIARHEVACSLQEVTAKAAALVRPKGKAAFVHRPERMAELFAAMQQVNLEPKRVQLIHPKPGRDANILLVEAVKDGAPGMKVEHPWTVYQENGEYEPAFYKYVLKGEGLHA
ncbi:tRNA1(Val) (adenine(37)-N6)-methyltransferase [Alkalicoccus luteus]|uniref:tRNA1(Val) (Adenine(37)-N6)-methyltransferase n=1 Tax=Alkalicoccus luteus TaxID=1237094 RepID=A0A969TYA9_9BACI|nr:tRNA1(Val) (adenine(37)-N6)-methyltransferase [Alkalicoccus luteus]NJP39009.1 tRNA1(Val) (adenine(37)-N6)-methyltransferase [Alkalicoccus luteus]